MGFLQLRLTHAHYFFSRIHPFHDGNGRMARLLTNFILLSQYIRSLQKADDGYFRSFLLFVAGLVRQSLETYLHAIEDGGGSGRRQQQKLLPLAELAKGAPYSAAYLRVLANRKAQRYCLVKLLCRSMNHCVMT
jgi:hypothetical protein